MTMSGIGVNGTWTLADLQLLLDSASLPPPTSVSDSDGVSASSSSSSPLLTDSPPTHLPSDYVEIVILCLMSAAGLATNAWALWRLMGGAVVDVSRRHPHATRRPSVVRKTARPDGNKTQQNALLVNLVVSNLLVLLVYCPCRVFWLVTYEWVLGRWACKTVNLLYIFVFCLASNTVTCIAVDRAVFVWRLTARDSLPGSSDSRKTLRLIAVGWLLAALCALPQWWLFDTVTPENMDFTQCVNVWDKRRYEMKEPSFDGLPKKWMYEVWHVVIVFWAPFACIVVCYTLVTARLCVYSCQSFTTVNVVPHALAQTGAMVAGCGRLPPSATHRTSPSVAAQTTTSICQTVTSLNLTPTSPQPTSSFNQTPTSPQQTSSFNQTPTSVQETPLLNQTPTCAQQTPPPSYQSVTSAHQSPAVRRVISAPYANVSVDSTTNDDCPAAAASISRSLKSIQSPLKAFRFRYGTSASSPNGSCRDGETVSLQSASPVVVTQVPAWRGQMRSRMFRTAAAIVGCYLLCWLPYNVLLVTSLVWLPFRDWVDMHGKWLDVLIVLNSILGPFLYRFSVT